MSVGFQELISDRNQVEQGRTMQLANNQRERDQATSSAIDQATRDVYGQIKQEQSQSAAMPMEGPAATETSIPTIGAGPQSSLSSQGPGEAKGFQASPFDTPEFTQRLNDQLATIPGGGAKLYEIKKERDGQISKLLEMVGNGNVDEARYLAQQNGLQIPDNLYGNGEVARAMAFSHKAYPDEPNKGQVFFQSFMGTQGDLTQKVNAAIAKAGRPTTAQERELSKSIALAKFNLAHQSDKGQTFQGADGGLYSVRNNQAAPITGPDGQPFQAKAGPGIGSGNNNNNRINLIKTYASTIAGQTMNGDPVAIIKQATGLADQTLAQEQQETALPPPAPQQDVQLNAGSALSNQQFNGGLGNYVDSSSISSSIIPQRSYQTTPVQITGAQDYATLPSGTPYIDPTGIQRVKP